MAHQYVCYSCELPVPAGEWAEWRSGPHGGACEFTYRDALGNAWHVQCQSCFRWDVERSLVEDAEQLRVASELVRIQVARDLLDSIHNAGDLQEVIRIAENVSTEAQMLAAAAVAFADAARRLQ